jgi:hypothetical protein
MLVFDHRRALGASRNCNLTASSHESDLPSSSGDCHNVTNDMAASTVAGDDREFFKWIEGTSVTERRGEEPADAEFVNQVAQAKLLPRWFADVVSGLVLPSTRP